MKFRILGHTTEGQEVVAGVYSFYETYGLPLEVVFQVLQGRGLLPCWVSFHMEAVAAGMAHERILSMLDPALSDIYGPPFRDYVLKGLRRLCILGRLA